MLTIDPGDAVPIWRQIEEGVLHRVASGGLAAGDALPSVRELARELRINPLTVSKAYQRLVASGVLEVRRGQGTFVAKDPPRLDEGQLGARLAAAAHRYVALGRTLGSDQGALLRAVDEAWNELEEGGES